jgi:glycosyltransferase involved in cell wall biosynthesis
MLYFPLRVFMHILLSKYDVVSVSTSPQVTLGWAAALACKVKKIKLVYHCMDIHPEIGAISGEFSNPIVFKILRILDNFTLKHSAKVIVLSSDMQKSLVERNYGNTDNINIINNFALSSTEEAPPEELNVIKLLKRDGILRLLFAGNVGRFQGLENLIVAFNSLDKGTHLELVFLGEGKALLELKKIALHPNIKFIPHMPISHAKIIMKNADFGIVSLENKVINYAYPSKTITYLEQGLPILALVESGTELSNMINEEGVGFTVENDDIEGIKKILNKLNAESHTSNNCMSRAASNFYINNFHKKKILDVWSVLIKEI